MSSLGMTVYGPEVARSGLTDDLDAFIGQTTHLKRAERFFCVHSSASITDFYALTGSTHGKHWPVVVDLFDLRPVCATLWIGENALSTLQGLKGKTHPAQAAPGTVRSRFYCDNPVTNLIHVSDSDDIMKAELTILRRQFSGETETAWRALASDHMSHSSFRVLLGMLGQKPIPPLAMHDQNDGALVNARFCYEQITLLASKCAMLGPVQQYLQGQCAGLDALLQAFHPVSAWNRILLEAGLFAMPVWAKVLAAPKTEQVQATLWHHPAVKRDWPEIVHHDERR